MEKEHFGTGCSKMFNPLNKKKPIVLYTVRISCRHLFKFSVVPFQKVYLIIENLPPERLTNAFQFPYFVATLPPLQKGWKSLQEVI
jgi:hypothetical protein